MVCKISPNIIKLRWLLIRKLGTFLFVYLDRAGNVETLLHTRDVELDHSQVFAFDYNASQRAHKSESEDFSLFNCKSQQPE